MSYQAVGYTGSDGRECTMMDVSLECGCRGIFVLVSGGVKQYCTADCPDHYDVSLDPQSGEALCTAPPPWTGSGPVPAPPPPVVEHAGMAASKAPLYVLAAVGIAAGLLYYR